MPNEAQPAKPCSKPLGGWVTSRFYASLRISRAKRRRWPVPCEGVRTGHRADGLSDTQQSNEKGHP